MTLAELSRLRSRVEHEYSSKRAIWRRPSIYWPARPTRPERQARSPRRSNIGSADVRRAKAPPSSAATLAHRGTRHRRVDRDRRRDCGRACPAGRAGGTRGTPEDRLDEIASGIREQATTSADNLPPQHFSDTAFEHLGVRRRPPRLPSLARKPRRHAPGFRPRASARFLVRCVPASGRDPGAWWRTIGTRTAPASVAEQRRCRGCGVRSIALPPRRLSRPTGTGVAHRPSGFFGRVTKDYVRNGRCPGADRVPAVGHVRIATLRGPVA
jgi:hypothetical protein